MPLTSKFSNDKSCTKTEIRNIVYMCFFASDRLITEAGLDLVVKGVIRMLFKFLRFRFNTICSVHSQQYERFVTIADSSSSLDSSNSFDSSL